MFLPHGSFWLPEDTSGAAAATPTFVVNGAVAQSNVAGSPMSLTPALPAGWSAGQFAVLICTGIGSSLNDATNISTPSGWTSIAQVVSGTPGTSNPHHVTRVLYRFLVGGDTDPTISITGNTPAVGQARICTFAGVNTGAPTEGLASTSATTTASYVNVTTSGANRLVIEVATTKANTSNPTITPSGSWTERIDNQANDGASLYSGLELVTQAKASTGTVTGDAFTSGSGGVVSYNIIAFAIKG